MNWTLLNEISHRATSGEMTVKEASDEVSEIWYLTHTHIYHKDLWLKFPSLEYPDWQNEHMRLIEITQELVRVQHPEREGFFHRWIESMPTEMKSSEIIKKMEKERLEEERQSLKRKK